MGHEAGPSPKRLAVPGVGFALRRTAPACQPRIDGRAVLADGQQPGAPDCRREHPRIGAAVDVGSTSVHLVVARVGDGRLEPLHDESAFLGLGAAIDARGFLGSAATAELAGVLKGFAERARALGSAGLAVIGTEPTRRALDGPRIVRAVEREAGLALQVVSHDEEGLLTLIGVTGASAVPGGMIVVDIGGGSTEIVAAGLDGRPAARGLPLGAARLSARFVSHDPPQPAEAAAMLDHARAALADAPRDGPADGRAALSAAGASIVAVGGTAENLLRIVPNVATPGHVSTADLVEAMARLAGSPAQTVAARHGVRPARARLLPAGAAILLAVLERYGAELLRVSRAGIREGAILAVAIAGVAWRDRLADLATGRRPPDPAGAGTPGPRPRATAARRSA